VEDAGVVNLDAEEVVRVTDEELAEADGGLELVDLGDERE
jgi:hypothetical protein